MEPTKDVHYFRSVLAAETTRLQSQVCNWRNELTGNDDLPQEVIGDINAVTGSTELLIRERFAQFATLIDDSEFKRSEKEINCQDLEGFWDIVYIEVEKIDKIYEKLELLRNHNWKVITESAGPPVKKTLPSKKAIAKSKPAKCSSSLRAKILAARKQLKQAQHPASDTVTIPEVQVLSETSAMNTRSHIGHRAEKSEEVLPDGLMGSGKENAPSGVKLANQTLQKRRKSTTDVNGNRSGSFSTFDGGFFLIVTPVKKNKRNSLSDLSKSARWSDCLNSTHLLSSTMLKEKLLTTPMKHKDYSPFMMITRSMKKKGHPFQYSQL